MVVLVVDGAASIIERWQTLLSEVNSINTVYGASSYEEAVRLFERENPGVILLDGSLPGDDTISFLKKIKEAGSKAAIIVLCNRVDDYIENQCKLNGADFFLDKYLEFEKVPEIIREIAAA
ncbi:MAG TPA: response regulator [Chitinophagaceae bacterium]|nr:response regulator [Chitinophagaceae bacterium]